MSYRGSGNSYLAGQRYAAKGAQQARRSHERTEAIEAAEQAFDDAYAAYEAEPLTGPRPAWEAFKAARDALFDLDPANRRFS